MSAESLQTVGYILESGLISGAWLNVRIQNTQVVDTDSDGIDSEIDTDSDGIIDSNDNCPDTPGDDDYGCSNEDEVSATSNDWDETTTGILLMLCILFVWGNFAWLVFADNRGEG